MKNIKNSMIFFSLLPSLFLHVKGIKKRSLSLDSFKYTKSLPLKKSTQEEGELPLLENSSFSFSKNFFKTWQHNQREIKKYNQKMMTLDNLHRDILFIQEKLNLYCYTHKLNLKLQEQGKINNFSNIREQIIKKIEKSMKIFEKKMFLFKEEYSTFFHPKFLSLEFFFSEPQEKLAQNIYAEFLKVIKHDFNINKKNYAIKSNQHFLFFLSFSNNKIYDQGKDKHEQINKTLKKRIEKNHHDVENFLYNNEEKKKSIYKKFLIFYIDYFFIINKKNFYFESYFEREVTINDFFSYNMVNNESNDKNDLLLKQFSLFFFHYIHVQQKETYSKRFLKGVDLDFQILSIKEKLLPYKEKKIKEIEEELQQVKRNLFNFRNLYELQNEVMESLENIYLHKNEENKKEETKKEEGDSFHFSQELKQKSLKQKEQKEMDETMKKIFLERKESFHNNLIFMKKIIRSYELEEKTKEEKISIIKNKILQTKEKIFASKQKMCLSSNDWEDIVKENIKFISHYIKLSLSYQLFQE